MHTPDTDSPFIRLRVTEFREHAGRAALATLDDIADRLGVNRSTIWRLTNGKMPPGERFIAAALARIPGAGFDDIFEVVDPEVAQGCAA